MAFWLAALLLALSVKSDEVVYSNDALSSNWQDWSWSSTINYAATDLAEGSSSMSVNSQAWAAVSLKDGSGTIQPYAGLQFDIAGDNPNIQLYFQSTADNNQTSAIPLSAFGANITSDKFTTLLVNFNNLPPGNGAILESGNWDRINFQAQGDGAVYHLDNIVLLDSIIVNPEVLSAEPFGNNVIGVTTVGAVNLTSIKVSFNGRPVRVAKTSTMAPSDTPSKSISYLTLESHFAPGNLSIKTDNGTFSFALPAPLTGSINSFISHPISDLIYGVNFPTSASYISNLGVTLSRWGGNAVTAYNPFGGFTNAGNDWYFENRVSDNADTWLGWVQGAASKSFLTIPALDWVSKDATSYSYSKSVYPDQGGFDPYNSDAGNGLFPNGSYITPVPDQSNVYTPWNSSLASQWLTSLVNKPTVVTIDNEIEIASNTHQDMHPIPIDYDEEVARVIEYGTMAKKTLPSVEVAAPSTCGWWFYWRSQVGGSDAVAHNNTDFLPYFLTQLHNHDKAAGKRLLDYLDLHWYYQADTSANDAAAKALRLRMTRALWDPTYVDESWIATSGTQGNNNQPNSGSVQLIPRIQALIQQHYPGTKFSLSEFASTADTDLTGGLVTVDMLGIFGRFKLDAATYWATPDEIGPVGLAYWLYRGYGVHFGSSSSQVNIPKLNPDTLGVYASSANGGRQTSLVVVNKDPSNSVAFSLTGVPAGTYLLRHFGGQAGVAKFQTTITIGAGSYITVPAYTAVFLQQQ